MTHPPAPAAARPHREVVSFVRRSNRMRPNQRSAWLTHQHRFVLEIARDDRSTSVHPEATLDLAAAYGRVAPLVVEVGPGGGESLVALAQTRPELNLLTFEVYRPAVAQIVQKLATAGVDNVRIVEADGVAGLRRLVPEAGLAELWTFFPDPWHKPRHHKRRLVGPGFAALATSRLAPGGVWRLATDWADYGVWMRDLLDAQPGLRRGFEGERAARWPDRPVSRFEQRGLDAGREIVDLTYVRA